jgi:hypothetical protein
MKWGQQRKARAKNVVKRTTRKKKINRDRTEGRGDEERRRLHEKYRRDGKNRAADTRRKGAPRTRDGKEEGREKRCGTDL